MKANRRVGPGKPTIAEPSLSTVEIIQLLYQIYNNAFGAYNSHSRHIQRQSALDFQPLGGLANQELGPRPYPTSYAADDLA